MSERVGKEITERKRKPAPTEPVVVKPKPIEPKPPTLEESITPPPSIETSVRGEELRAEKERRERERKQVRARAKREREARVREDIQRRREAGFTARETRARAKIRTAEKLRTEREAAFEKSKVLSDKIKSDLDRGVGGFKTSKSGISGKDTVNVVTVSLVGLTNFITKYTPQATLSRFANDIVGATLEARKDLGNILRGLKGLSDTFKAQGNFPTRAEADAFFKANPGARFDLGATTPLTPKTVDEWFGRLGFAATEASLGGLIEFTLPMSIGLAPPQDVFDVQMRLVGALVTPSPSDFAIAKIASSLARLGKEGQRTLRKLLTGSSLNADEAIQFEKAIGSFGVSTNDLRKSRTTLFKDIPLDEIGSTSRKADDILSDLAGKTDWSGGIDDVKVSSPLDQRKVIRDINNQLADYRKTLETLTDIDPDGNLTNWGLLSTREKQKFLAEFKKLDELFENNPELFGAGAAYKPAALQEFQDILTDHGVFQNADEYLNFLDTYKAGRTFVITPAALTVLITDLNTTVDDKLNPARIAPTIDDPITSPGRPDIDIKEILETQDITDPKELTIPELKEVVEPEIPDVIPVVVPIVVPDVIPKVTPDVIPDVVPKVSPKPVTPEEIQKVEEISVLTPAQIAETRLRAKEEREAARGIRKPPPARRPKVSRRPSVVVKPPKIPSFPKDTNFKVRFRTFIGGEIIRVRAKNFREAEIKAERKRKSDKDILEVEVTRI